MATSYTREWIGFFIGCGIPEDVATMYALIFYENRIQKNMLLDLNKEYLKDMGITVMGDVIAILRHSKTIHDKYVREQILSVDESLPESKSESGPIEKSSTPMKRILKHYTRKYDSPEFDLNEIEHAVVNDRVLPGKGSETVRGPIKRKISGIVPEENVKASKIHSAKAKRMLVEQDGGYKVKLPSATTERSKKLLEQAKKKKAKTVFERLGESSVSSTTSEISSTSTASTPLCKEKNPSVFARLGEKTPVVSSTSCIDDKDAAQDQLPYAGILKTPPQTKFGKTTMRADEQMQSDGIRSKNGASVKKRLGLSQAPEQSESRSRTLIKTTRQTGQEANPLQGVTKKSARVTLTKGEMAPGKLVTQGVVTSGRGQKRKSGESTESSPSKRVRFGNISHRLIPGNPDKTEPNAVKNYSKLTMTISNIISDSNRIGVKARVGNLPVKGRLGNRTQMKRISTIKDRLG